MAKIRYRLEGSFTGEEYSWLPSCDGFYDDIKDGLIRLREMQAAADRDNISAQKLLYRLVKYEVIAQ